MAADAGSASRLHSSIFGPARLHSAFGSIAMPGCILNATGTHFDVDTFMSKSPWRDSASVFHRGEATRLRSRPTHEHSGLGVRISDSDEDELESQIRDAMEFLKQERQELERLRAFPGVECLEFRIGVFWWRNTCCQFHSFPAEFSALAGELGIVVTLCVYGVSRDEPEAEPNAPPNSGPAERFDHSGVSGGPPPVS